MKANDFVLKGIPMQLDKELTAKVLDPIHGIIRLTEIEIAFIDHPLFQRLRNIKQNSFLYKVFPSAMHSRFEHSLGVMNLAYEIIDNMRVNAHRYESKYDDGRVYPSLLDLPTSLIQELRLAALLHDIGHGPMSHQFDAFLCDKDTFRQYFAEEFPEIVELNQSANGVEHEHISLLFIRMIYDSLPQEMQSQINIHNVMAMIEKEYQQEIRVEVDDNEVNILPLLTSIISSCPIDADRMDYLLRDSYFSGVKCGIYDNNRLFMSMVPVQEGDTVYLAYKESGLDSMVEFINSRSHLFSQVYYHKTNRAFCTMLDKVCELAKKEDPDASLMDLHPVSDIHTDAYSLQLKDFYLNNSDDYFLNEQLEDLIEHNTPAIEILNDIIERKPWRKVYESKFFPSDVCIRSSIDKAKINELKSRLIEVVESCGVHSSHYNIDIMTDNTFKDIHKTEVKLLTKQLNGQYDLTTFKEANHKLGRYQSIKCFIRVFCLPSESHQFDQNVITALELCKENFVKNHSLVVR